jgi:hypothetical protein
VLWSPDAAEVDSIEQHRELRRIDLDGYRRWVRLDVDGVEAEVVLLDHAIEPTVVAPPVLASGDLVEERRCFDPYEIPNFCLSPGVMKPAPPRLAPFVRQGPRGEARARRRPAARPGRDLSVYRVQHDLLAGTSRTRVIVQCKHWLSKTLNVEYVSLAWNQMALWNAPPVDVLVIATSGRFSTDAVDWIEKHNDAQKQPGSKCGRTATSNGYWRRGRTW